MLVRHRAANENGRIYRLNNGSAPIQIRFMQKQSRRQKLVLKLERVRQLTPSDLIEIAGGLHITDGSNATNCLPETHPPCESENIPPPPSARCA